MLISESKEKYGKSWKLHCYKKEAQPSQRHQLKSCQLLQHCMKNCI